ncbi:hypothetical protein WOSG25_180380 [Weissella oryzae SG25]|uniref:Uncharacterized protein n=1 Tax=Weissella oryzae (strain DSM 25784 / JCM 18191 / LMG 30913 / SG25) TaxID=1329250 RepID=A0A069CWY6_WEIOS|nr:hypothetical protein [Weissella oryzae]GAK31887.1 hypothetical protein WOSG25_180380 [Weissella oryzae SG25]
MSGQIESIERLDRTDSYKIGQGRSYLFTDSDELYVISRVNVGSADDEDLYELISPENGTVLARKQTADEIRHDLQEYNAIPVEYDIIVREISEDE